MIAAFCFLAAVPASCGAQLVSSPITLPLWPASSRMAVSSAIGERDTTTANDALVGGKRVIRLTNVSDPAIIVYRPDPAIATKTAILVFPGGGYQILAMDLEGTEICAWLNARGITAVLVKYHVPTAAPHLAPLQDGQRAIRLVRAHAADWDIDPQHIGVMGFSAGGNVAARLSTSFDSPAYAPSDGADKLSSRPDFTILIYPAYLAADTADTQLAADLHVSSKTPPAFLVQAQDDPIGVMNSIDYYIALTKNKVPAEMHLYTNGGHGYGLRPSVNAISAWPIRLQEWLQAARLIAR